MSDRFPFIPPGLMAVLIAIFHQILLSNGVTEFVMSDVRRNFVEANKEGISSLLGFVSIYFFGVHVGQILWKKRLNFISFYSVFYLTNDKLKFVHLLRVFFSPSVEFDKNYSSILALLTQFI